MARLSKIDHVHLFVPERERAARWYQQHLGFSVVEPLRVWAEDPQGPLTIGLGDIHIALFSRSEAKTSTHIAFGCDAPSFLYYKDYFERLGLLLRCSDHDLAFSLYIQDPWGNQHEISSYQHRQIRAQL